LSNLEAKYVIWQVKIWDWFAKAMPFIIAIAGGSFYLLGYRDWNLVYSTGAIFFVTVAVTWWFWVIYTIAAIAIVISNSGKSIQEIIKEIKEIRKVINDEKNNDNR
jgi:hypothetical protein